MSQILTNKNRLRARDIADLLGVTPETVGDWARHGLYGFPRPVTINSRTRFWWRSDIDRWLESRRQEVSAHAV